MKKKTKIILIIILLFTFLSGIIDYMRVKNDKKPLFMIKIPTANLTKSNYVGLGYRWEKIIINEGNLIVISYMKKNVMASPNNVAIVINTDSKKIIGTMI